MNKLSAWLLGILVAGSAACGRPNEETDKKLDQALAKLDSIEKKVDSSGGFRGGPAAAGMPGQPGQPGQPQRPPGPDPATTYSVDIKGSAYEGPEHAEITIVEAFDFA
jgi:hypothetical protein